VSGTLQHCEAPADGTIAAITGPASPTVACPKCGSPNLEHQEFVLVKRTVRENAGGKLVIDGLYESCGECSRDEVLYCLNCNHEFPMPDGVEPEYI